MTLEGKVTDSVGCSQLRAWRTEDWWGDARRACKRINIWFCYFSCVWHISLSRWRGLGRILIHVDVFNLNRLGTVQAIDLSTSSTAHARNLIVSGVILPRYTFPARNVNFNTRSCVAHELAVQQRSLIYFEGVDMGWGFIVLREDRFCRQQSTRRLRFWKNQRRNAYGNERNSAWLLQYHFWAVPAGCQGVT